MKTNTKIRWLLFLVTVGLFATSLTARWASTKSVKLYDIADDISYSLHRQEKIVSQYLTGSKNFEKLKSLTSNPDLASETLQYFGKKRISFQTYKNKQLTFWSDAVINASNAFSLNEGTSFVHYNSGWYEVMKKSDGDFFALFFIPIKPQLPFKNKYLNTEDSKEFIITDPSIDIAKLSDKEVANIKNTSGKYIFSIKKDTSYVEVPYSDIEIWLWCLGLITLGGLINSLCRHYANIGYPLLATTALALSIFLLRYLGLKYHFPQALYSLSLFDPKIYASNFYFPSFADFALNVIGFLWLLVFIHSKKTLIFKTITNRFVGYCIFVYAALFVGVLSYFYSDVFFGLVFNSNINFQVSNLVNLNWISVVGIIVCILALLCYYLVLDILVHFSIYIQISNRNKLISLLLAFLFFAVYGIICRENPVYTVLVFSIILIVIALFYQEGSKPFFPSIILISFIFATIVSLKLNTFEKFKEHEIKRWLLLKLENAEDAYANISFSEVEKDIANDKYLAKLIREKPQNNTKLNARVSASYLTGYLNKFDYKAHLFDQHDSLISVGNQVTLDRFKKQVEESAIKVSNSFYSSNKAFGVQNYFAIIPIKENNTTRGTLVLELASKQLALNGKFPLLLQNGDGSQHREFHNYSYALYQNKKLTNQYGLYVYNLTNTEFKGVVKDFVLLNQDGYEHLIYKPSKNNTIIVSSEASTFWRELASLSFFFIIFLVFSLFATSYKWLASAMATYSLDFKTLRLKFLEANSKILYKTRIQIALVLAVVSSSVIIGIITFSYISIQYQEQQRDFLKSKIRTITTAFQENIFRANESIKKNTSSISFDEFARMYISDLNLFDSQGRLIHSTQYKIYASGLLTDRMNAEAYLNLKVKQKSEFIQEEYLNKLKFTSAYMPIKDRGNDVVGYLQLPYFANQEDYNQKIGTFLNLLINIYVLVFVVIGFFAFVVANQITSPLSLIQESISKTMIGSKNNPIEWRRNDEIGSLIKEYNAMIGTLEENANKLAQSERETAWREMAKQVAHEIKNPLTPLRLGIQMLDRAWREKDERFDEKFNKFSKSFLEQIDSLSRIASEFSNFAKMPELKLERVNLLGILKKVIEVFSQMEHIKVICDDESLKNTYIKADKDQLLRSFNNLLKNGIEAIPDGRDGIIKISGQRANGKIEIQISDNGSGIPLSSRDNIFVPNFTTKSSGTGLGLAFVKQAIQNVNGNIYFTTETDVGTTFYITLPVVS